MRLVRLACIGILAALFVAASPAWAQDVAAGRALYQQYCVSCHGMPPAGGPERAEGDPSRIRLAISSRVPDMRFLSFLTDANLADIAAWLASLIEPPPAPVPTRDYSDLWYGGEAESGWGLTLIQHANHQVFGVMYTYDTSGRPTWFVLPGGTWTSAMTFTGAWYRAVGQPYHLPWAPGQVRQVGVATITFLDANRGTLDFAVDGVTVRKPLERQPF